MDLSHHRSIFCCLFLAGPGGWRVVVADAPDRQCWAKAGRRAVLGKGRPAGGVGRRPPRTWCTDPRNPLFFHLFCTKSPGLFGARPPRTWCTNPRKTLFFRSLCTKSPDIFGTRPLRTWCTNPRIPLFFRLLCTKSPGLFGARPLRTWCTNSRNPLFFRLLCTKSPDIFGARPPTPPRSSPFLNRRLTSAQFCCIIPSVNFWS